MLRKFKKLPLLLFLCYLCTFSKAQNINWMLGTWQGTGKIAGSIYSTNFIRTLVIDSVYGNEFKGTRTKEFADKTHAKIVTALSGSLSSNGFVLQNGAIIYKKDPAHGAWLDCSSCAAANTITIHKDSIILSTTINGCQRECDGTSAYYKPLCSYDSSTQVYLVHLFGSADDIAAFTACKEIPQVTKEEAQKIKDPLNIAAESVRKKQQFISDSLANIEAAAKKRRQQLQDSVNNAYAIAERKQQQLNDSLKIAEEAVQKQQEQFERDSMNNALIIAKQKQQHIEDSLQNVAMIVKKRQQELSDSLTKAEKRQQQINDSLINIANIAKKKQQQHIQDSLTAAAFLVKQKQQLLTDSIINAAKLAKQRQQQVDDSLNLAAKIAEKRTKQIQDSLTEAANITKLRRQQFIADSLAAAVNIAKQKQDSLTNAAKQKVVPTDTTAAKAQADKSKLLTQRDNVLIQTYHITSQDILIELFDNAQIDGDRVSVFHNNTLIVNNQTLLRKPITFTFHADAANRTHEFVLIAENLGTIPPNTALMRITVGKDVYKLSVRTDLKTNARIIFQYDGN